MTPENEAPRLSIAQGNTCRILQITDLHTDADEEANERTWADIQSLIGRLHPHLLAVTGDIWCSDEEAEFGQQRMARDIARLDSFGAPWAFCWGNHDYIPNSLDDAMTMLAQARHSLVPSKHHQGAYRISVAGASALHWDLFFLNSGPRWRLPEDLNWFLKESEALKAQRRKALPAIAYFHLPLKNYQDAIDSHRQVGSGEEEVLCWGDEAGLGADLLKQAGVLEACFCGHSHRNDFYFSEGGIVFAYGRAGGYGGYGEDSLAKGATLLELDLHSRDFSLRTVFANGQDLPAQRFTQESS